MVKLVLLELPGKDAQQVTVDEKTGELKIDGKGTGIFPAKDAAKAPVKAEGGYWYTLNEKGEYENTNIPVSGITVTGLKLQAILEQYIVLMVKRLSNYRLPLLQLQKS